jgi:uncharacterized protein YbjT (DUF2867 family)
MLVTVMGATGNTGQAAAQRLLASGVQVRAIGRSKDKLAALAKAGAQTVIADAAKGSELAAAFRGADAIYAMVPPHFTAPDVLAYYETINTAIAAGITESGVKRVVYLSSIGGELPSGTGPIVGLHQGEERLKTIAGLDVLFLRPGYFYENHFGALGLVKSQGLNGGATKPDLSFVQISAHDVGDLAGRALAAKDFSGVSVRELFGPRNLSMAEATTILGSKIGKPDLKYVQFPDEGVVGGLKGAGFSENVARSFVAMSQAFNESRITSHQTRGANNTGTTAFETFAEGWAQAYQAA